MGWFNAIRWSKVAFYEFETYNTIRIYVLFWKLNLFWKGFVPNTVKVPNFNISSLLSRDSTSRTCILEKNYVWQASWIASLQKCQIFLNLRFLFFFVNLCSKRHYIHLLSVLGHKHAFEWSPPVSIFILNGTEPKFKFL